VDRPIDLAIAQIDSSFNRFVNKLFITIARANARDRDAYKLKYRNRESHMPHLRKVKKLMSQSLGVVRVHDYLLELKRQQSFDFILIVPNSQTVPNSSISKKSIRFDHLWQDFSLSNRSFSSRYVEFTHFLLFLEDW